MPVFFLFSALLNAASLAGAAEGDFQEILRLSGPPAVVSTPANSTAAPADCAAVDLRPKLPPVRNQDSIGWCYAFAAADLLSFKLGKNISAIDLGLAHGNSRDSYFSSVKAMLYGGDEARERVVDGGSVSEALEAGAKRGLCLEAALPARDFSSAQEAAQLRETLRLLSSLRQQFQVAPEGAYKVSSCAMFATRAFELIPGLNPKDVMEILERSSSEHTLDRLAAAACEPRIRSRMKLEVNSVYILGGPVERNYRPIDRVLNSGKPLAVSYDVRVLGVPVDQNGFLEHASTLAGRRWNAKTNTCEYLLRNSWGANCIPAYTLECDGGNLWVPRDRLIRAAKRVDYVD